MTNLRQHEIDLTPAAAVPRRSRLRRSGAAAAATAVVALSTLGGPLAAVTSAAPATAGRAVLAQAGGGVLDQAGSGPSSGSGRAVASPGGGGKGSGDLNVAPNFNAPGISQGKELIGWAKAGAMVLGTIGLIGGVVASKVMQNAGNHHAGGVRQSAFGIGGALVLAGSAATIVPWLMG